LDSSIIEHQYPTERFCLQFKVDVIDIRITLEANGLQQHLCVIAG